MICRDCGNPRKPEDFFIVRDGKKLPTRPCRFCIASANVKHNREQKRKLA